MKLVGRFVDVAKCVTLENYSVKPENTRLSYSNPEISSKVYEKFKKNVLKNKLLFERVEGAN